MPLLKKAQTPAAGSAAVAEPPAQTKAPATDSYATVAVPAHRELQPKDLDRKSREIQRQGAFQAALQSVGVVQHGGKSFADYLDRVRQAADAELVYINER